MATRIYFPSSSSPPAAFAAFPIDAAWETDDVGNRGLCSVLKADTDFAWLAQSEVEVTQPYDVPIIQYIAGPLTAQTINGTIKGQLRVFQDTAGADFCRAMVIRVVSGDGLFVRGTLLEDLPSPIESEWDIVPENRFFPPAATPLTEVIAQEGDYLVIEIGFRSFNTDGEPAHYGRVEVGDPIDGTDLPADETETGQKRGWLEFSGNLTWKPDPYEVVASGGMELAGEGIIAFESPTVLEIVGEGGMEIGGAGIIVMLAPGDLEIIGEGGMIVGGKGIVAVVFPDEPPVYAHVGSGGVKFSGEGVISFILPAVTGTVQDLAVVGSGGVALGGAGILEFIPPPVLEVVGAGGMTVGGVRVPELTVVRFIDPTDLTLIAVTTPVALELGGEGIITHFQPDNIWAVPSLQDGAEAVLQLGGQGCIAFITPQVLNVLGEGEILLGVEPGLDGTFDTYVLTGFRNEPSLYSNFNFNSYAKHQGKFYGAKEDGVYLLEGDDDAGEEIHPGMRIGPANFGTDREKRLRLLRLGGECGQARVKVSNGNGAAGYYEVEQGVVPVSREIQGRQITIDIMDFESLNHLEIVAKVLARR